MKTIKITFFSFLTVILSLTITSCGDDGDGGNVDCDDAVAVNAAIADEVQAINTATEAYIADPTNTALCEDFRKAYEEYIDALKNLQDCANEAGVGDDFAEGITNAEIAIQDLDCN